MLAVTLDHGAVALADVPFPSPDPNSALIRVRLAGICNTDLELKRGYYGFSGTPGHEFCGVVEQCQSQPELIGQRVVGEINLACGRCASCQHGIRRHCPNRTVLGIVRHPGAFAEFLTLPSENVHVIPDNMPDETAVFVEPLAAACEILDQIDIVPEMRTLVLGDGKLGLLVSQVLQSAGARVTVNGRHPAKLSVVGGRGIEVTTEPPPPASFPLAIDCTGSAAGLTQAVQSVAPLGTVVMKSTIHEPVNLDMAPVIVNEITLKGSRCGRFEPAISLLASRKVDVSGMIAAEYKLRDAPKAFEKAAERGVLKVLLRP